MLYAIATHSLHLFLFVTEKNGVLSSTRQCPQHGIAILFLHHYNLLNVCFRVKLFLKVSVYIVPVQFRYMEPKPSVQYADPKLILFVFHLETATQRVAQPPHPAHFSFRGYPSPFSWPGVARPSRMVVWAALLLFLYAVSVYERASVRVAIHPCPVGV